MRTSVPTAEMVKYASNAFLATKISFINEIANVCEQVGADVRTVAHGMGLDHRIGPHFLQAGIGYGGSCFPKDVQALKQLAGNSGYHFQLLNAVIEVNALQKRRVLGKLKQPAGHAARQDASRCSASPSSRTPTTSARRPRSSSPRASSTRAPRCAPTTPCSTPATHPLFPGVTITDEPLRGARGRRRGGAGHRVAASSRASTGRPRPPS